MGNPLSLLSLAEIKQWLLVEHDEDDAVITRLYKAVISKLESRMKRQIVQCRVTVIAKLGGVTRCTDNIGDNYVYRNGYTACVFYLPRLPFDQPSTVSKRQTDGSYTLLAESDYLLSADTAILEINEAGIYSITYASGYHEDNPLPEAIKQAILFEMAYRYENRNDKTVDPGLTNGALLYIAEFINTRYAV